MTALSWGRRYLMCPPDFFGVAYEINPWMHTEVTVDLDRARSQWEALRSTIEQAGAEVEILEAQPELPDLVFTANAGLVDGNRFVPAHFRNVERQRETPVDIAWFSARGFEVAELAVDHVHEGAGDALPFSDADASHPVLVSGYRTRSDAAAHADLSRLLNVAVLSIELVDQRLYHLDLTFCPLDDRHAIVAPDAWDEYGRRVMHELVPEPLVLSIDEALEFTANAVVVGEVVVLPACSTAVRRQLESWGFTVEVVDVSEFLKAGGGCRCLTLALDVRLAHD